MLKKVRLNLISGRKNKKESMKKLLALCLTASFIVFPCIQSSASVSSDVTEESQIDLEERVFEEIQTGEITNDVDAIKVALNQYRERKIQAARRSELGQETNVDDSLSITQVLDSKIDERGNITEDILSTNLIVLDENDNIMTASYLEGFDTSKYGELSSFSIYATMTVNVTKEIGTINKVRFGCFDTTLRYGTAQKATSLIQTAWHHEGVGFTYNDVYKTISEPQANVKYRYTPLNLEFVSCGRYLHGRECESQIYVGSNSLNIRYSYTFDSQNDGKGMWNIY